MRLPSVGGVRSNFTLAVVCAVLFLTFLDTTIVSVALSDVQSRLHAGVTALQWVVNGYALTFASLMLIAGSLSDRFGRRKLMLGRAGHLRLGLPARRPGAQQLGAHRCPRDHGQSAPPHPNRARSRSSVTSTRTGRSGREHSAPGPPSPVSPLRWGR